MGAVFILLSLIGVFVGAAIKGANPIAVLTNIPAILIVVVGAVAATGLSFDIKTTTSALKAIPKAIMGVTFDRAALAVQLVSFARTANVDSPLALEAELENIEDPFLRRGVEMAVNSVEPAVIVDVMESEIAAMRGRHKHVAAWMVSMGVYAPSFGIIGAVFGLIATMGHLDDPSKIGYGIAGAFAATFWGVYLANGLFLPFGNRLKELTEAETAYRRLAIVGVVGIAERETPTKLAPLLLASLSPAEREEAEADIEAARGA